MRIVIILVLILLIALFAYWQYQEHRPTVKVANWNLQIFGDKKASDPALLQFYAGKIQNYDIIFIQEIRDADNSSFKELCHLLVNYSCTLSSRAGRSTSKEQYGLFYKNTITLDKFVDYNPSYNETFERPPVRAGFTVQNVTFTLYNIHVKPDDVRHELVALERLVDPQGMVVVLGDMNADCDYYTERNDIAFRTWTWAITDSMDTTVSSRSCTYDRIIVNKGFAKAGVDSTGITPAVSDHYLVWASLYLEP